MKEPEENRGSRVPQGAAEQLEPPLREGTCTGEEGPPEASLPFCCIQGAGF